MKQAEIKELVELFSDFLQKKNEATSYGVQMKSQQLKSAIAVRIHAMTTEDLVDYSKIFWTFEGGVMKMQGQSWLKIEKIVQAVLEEYDKTYHIQKESELGSSLHVSTLENPPLTAGDAYMSQHDVEHVTTDTPINMSAPTEETFTAGDALMKSEQTDSMFYPFDTIDESPKGEQTYEAGDSKGNW